MFEVEGEADEGFLVTVMVAMVPVLCGPGPRDER